MKLNSVGIARMASILLGLSIPISTAFDNVLLVVIFVSWLISGYWRYLLPMLRENMGVLGAVLFCFSLLLGTTYGQGGDNWVIHYLGKYADLMFIPIFATLFVEDRHKFFGIAAFIIGMMITLIISLGFWGHFLPLDHWVANRSIDNPVVFKLHITQNFFMALAVYFSAVGMLFIKNRNYRAMLGLFALLAAANTIFMVQGRTGYVVLAVLLLYLSIYRWRWKGFVLLISCSILIGGIAVLTKAPIANRLDVAVKEIETWKPNHRIDTSMGQRMNLWVTSISIMHDHPMLGVGLGGFEPAFREKVANTDIEVWSNPHNQYLLTGVQLGIVGLISLIIMFVWMWRTADNQVLPYKLCLKGVLLAFVIGNLFNSFFIDHSERVFFAWCTGLLLSMAYRPKDAEGLHRNAETAT